MSKTSVDSERGTWHLLDSLSDHDSPFLKMLEVEKYHGAENDFIFLEMSSAQFSKTRNHLGQLAKTLCSRNTGVGADGLVIWEAAEDKTFRMSIWNADGSFASTCGNALRCFGLLLLLKKHWHGEHEVMINRFLEEGNEGFAHLVSCSLPSGTESSGRATVKMGSLHRAEALPSEKISTFLEQCAQSFPSLGTDRQHQIGGLDFAYEIELANPHVVLCFSKTARIKDLVDFAQNYGEQIKNYLLSSGLIRQEVNLGFLCASDETILNPESNLLVVHERGAGVTRACGSGAVAAAFALLFGKAQNSANLLSLAQLRGTSSKQQLIMPGGKLSITLENVGSHEINALMEGPCTFLFKATLSDQAGFRLPRSSSS